MLNPSCSIFQISVLTVIWPQARFLWRSGLGLQLAASKASWKSQSWAKNWKWFLVLLNPFFVCFFLFLHPLISRVLPVLGDCKRLQSLETRALCFNLRQAHSTEFWVNLGGELFSCPQGPFYLIYDQSHCEASTVMRTFFKGRWLHNYSHPLRTLRECLHNVHYSFEELRFTEN